MLTKNPEVLSKIQRCVLLSPVHCFLELKLDFKMNKMKMIKSWLQQVLCSPQSLTNSLKLIGLFPLKHLDEYFCYLFVVSLNSNLISRWKLPNIFSKIQMSTFTLPVHRLLELKLDSYFEKSWIANYSIRYSCLHPDGRGQNKNKHFFKTLS